MKFKMKLALFFEYEIEANTEDGALYKGKKLLIDEIDDRYPLYITTVSVEEIKQ